MDPTGHAGDQVDVVVQTSGLTAVEQRFSCGLVFAVVHQILGLIAALHRTSPQTILEGRRWGGTGR